MSPAQFHSPLTVRRLAGGSSVLIDALVYYSAVADRTIVVPAGFETDFASVPRLPLAFWLFGGLADEAAVVHDFIYSRRMFPREKCDEVFSEAMKACGLAGWRRGPMWFGVRLFGGSHY